MPRALGRYGEELATTEQEAAGDLTTYPPHPADEGTEMFDRELDAQESSRLTSELDEINERWNASIKRRRNSDRTSEVASTSHSSDWTSFRGPERLLRH